MSSNNIEKFIKNYSHGFPLYTKYYLNKDDVLKKVWEYYQVFRTETENLTILNDDSVIKMVELTNNYRMKVISILESRKNAAQENLRSTILEELFQILFKDLVKNVLKEIKDQPNNIVLRKANSYVSLTFAPYSFKDIFNNPNPYIHTKDQDFVLGTAIKLIIQTSNKPDIPINIANTIIPIVAIECKTYIERNMLDSCAATARRLKAAMPYCKYIVASEYMKMGDSFPELTDIDEVFILCKASNSDRERFIKEHKEPHKIDPNLIIDLFNMVKKHLNSIWWDPEKALERGKIINRE